MDGKNRSAIKIGALVNIVLKKDQPTGKLTRGHVKRILTNAATHPHGIKVMLGGGPGGQGTGNSGGRGGAAMKKLIFVGGAMGVGKTAACRELQKILTPCVWLDGDWCCNMNPFEVTPESKAMALSNNTHLLRSFLAYSGCEYVIFSWVMHEQAIIDSLLQRLTGVDFEFFSFSLVCSEAALAARLRADIDRGARHPDVLERSLGRLPLYQSLDTVKIDVGRRTPMQAAERIRAIVKGN